MTPEKEKRLLDLRNTGLPVVTVVAIILGTVGVTRTGMAVVSRLDALESGQQDRWTRKDETIQTLRLKLLNPELRVPDPNDQTKEI